MPTHEAEAAEEEQQNNELRKLREQTMKAASAVVQQAPDLSAPMPQDYGKRGGGGKPGGKDFPMSAMPGKGDPMAGKGMPAGGLMGKGMPEQGGKPAQPQAQPQGLGPGGKPAQPQPGARESNPMMADLQRMQAMNQSMLSKGLMDPRGPQPMLPGAKG